MTQPSNPLLSTKSSDTGLEVVLHPLVLLNISDHITRHVARQQQGPIVGALLGQQIGRTISLEHVFECYLIKTDEGIILHRTWFDDRLRQFKDVHKNPPLDLMGWFTLTSTAGPTAAQLPIHRQILQDYNETSVLLSFHAEDLGHQFSSVGKLPITIYESVYEEGSSDGDQTMSGGGQQATLMLKFRELPYTIETDETEMIGIDFVAKGAGNASAVTQEPPTRAEKEKASQDKSKDDDKPELEESPLTHEEEDLIANLSTRLNAVKTLDSRLRLIESYLANSTQPSEPASETLPPRSYSLIRSIYALISRLALLKPQDPHLFATETLAQANDVSLVQMLSALGGSIQELRELGRKFSAVEERKAAAPFKEGPLNFNA